MIKKILRVVIFIPVAIILIALSITNRQAVTLALNPFDPSDTVLSVTAPFFVYVFLALITGLILGSCVTWWRQGKHRKTARRVLVESERWHTEADKQKAKADDLAKQLVSSEHAA